VANLYGVATPNPLPVWVSTIGSANIACPAGVETNVVALAFNPALSSGWYYPNVWGLLGAQMGATAPSSCNIGLRLGNGADILAISVGSGLLVANGYWVYPVALAGFQLIMSNPYGANTFNVTLNPVGQAITASQNGTFLFGQWVRAPDQ
jgi:hypothetical protein